jgi:hypothetical protein
MDFIARVRNLSTSNNYGLAGHLFYEAGSWNSKART